MGMFPDTTGWCLPTKLPSESRKLNLSCQNELMTKALHQLVHSNDPAIELQFFETPIKQEENDAFSISFSNSEKIKAIRFLHPTKRGTILKALNQAIRSNK